MRRTDEGSGTIGGLVALGLSLWLGSRYGWPAQLVAAVALTAVSVWAAAPFARDGDDPAWVVIDEAAGAVLATVGLLGWPALAGFLVFRVADIFKRAFPGVAAAERIPGSWGVTADDLVAGSYGLAAGHLVAFLGTP